MIELRPFSSLGAANHGWLDAHHHFSFANYHDPARMGWGNLRVWNDDVIAPKTGFPPHPHSDMEIITYVREGAITHKDNLGNHGRTEAGDVQVMSAGTGIAHSEYNMEDVDTRIFQIWILPTSRGESPSWGARPFPKGDRAGQFVVLASGYDDDDALRIRTDARVLGATLKAGESATYRLGADRRGYMVPAAGRVSVNGVEVNARDGAAIRDLDTITVTAIEDAEIVLVDAA
ncbi:MULTISPECIES: pirin family protein [Sphingomonadales]|uniref:Pirin family protein n=2 Tax=Edaphosphingomonas TaxID=3423724 RepID=A0A2T4I051_9SPHN|nr:MULTISPECIES: pirin family protein [Sphingomonas]AGH50061.1 pirin [Sphingomonas sp. MM-1]MDX3883077.1 pirin family protein [Sphingomonas sp.]OHT18419.1 Quercetin 2,3-dioxygenase [Sphingomonas haloaromaticamans]PTD22093.1 pirin family protein [Sphingomonas fennica]